MRVDASVHIFPKSDADLRTFLREPFKSRGFPVHDVAFFAPPDGVRYAAGSAGESGEHAGSDPAAVGRVLFDERGFDYAVLHPMTGGVLPDRYLGSAILAATNDMMVERWLSDPTYGSRFRGTIRVNPNDLEGAVKEINRWKGDPRIAQIGIPLESQEPYGRPHFRPLWEAAIEAGLPVAMHLEMGVGIAHPPTMSGVPRTYAHLVAIKATNYMFHLLNMIPEGVFERYPELKIVFADGGADFVTPFMWRMDTFGRPHVEQTPWAPRMPSAYLPDHVYFVQGTFDGAGDVEWADEWLRMTGKADMVMFGSSYPDWQTVWPEDLPEAWRAEQRENVLWRTAAELYRLPVPVSVA